jgi:hypothetical protein
MVAALELQRRGLRHAVMVDAAATTASLQALDRQGLAYAVKVADGATTASRAALEARGLAYFVPVLVDATSASKAILDRQGLRYAVQVDADILPADRAVLDRQGLRYFVEVDSSGNSVAPGGGAYTAVAVNFDGTNDWLTRDAQFASVADGKTGLLSLWFNKLGGDGALCQLFGTTVRFGLRFWTTNGLDLVGANAAGSSILQLRTTPTYLAGSGWKHVLASWDLNATTGQLYVNDATPALSVNTRTNDLIDYTNTDWSVGALPAGTSKYTGDLAEVFFHNTFLDLSVTANRRLFVSPTGKPVNLGANGSTPLGVQPVLYLANPLATWHTNLGSGAGLTLHGALTSASTNPNAVLLQRLPTLLPGLPE